MNDRSKIILEKLEDSVRLNNIPIEEFPLNDTIQMIYAEYVNYVELLLSELKTTLNAYKCVLHNGIERSDKEEFLDILHNLIMYSKEGLFEILNSKEQILSCQDSITIKQYKAKALDVYNKFVFHSTLVSDKVPFRGKGVIYTVITGNYDELQEPEYINEKYDYICFTDNERITSNNWEIRYLDNPEKLDAARLSRKPKILCYEYLSEYDYSIYVDGKIKIIGDLDKYIQKFSKGSSMLCFPHFVRECAYQEAIAVISANKDSAEIVQNQMKEYAEEGYPSDNGLIDAACLVRLHNDENLRKVLLTWWKEVKNKSRRDQLSFGYSCWKHGFFYDICSLYTYDNEYLCKSRTWERPI